MALHPLSPASAGSLADIVPKNWHRYPSPISAAMLAPAYTPVIAYTGGVYGDDVTQSTANSTDAYAPKTQAAKAALPGAAPPNAIAGEPDFTLATDITVPRGSIAPLTPYPKAGDAAPAAPVISSLSPNTAVAGGPDIVVTINGTGFTQWTQILNGGVQNVTAYYVSPTKMAMAFEVSSSAAGITPVIAVDHGVASAASNFTFT